MKNSIKNYIMYYIIPTEILYETCAVLSEALYNLQKYYIMSHIILYNQLLK